MQTTSRPERIPRIGASTPGTTNWLANSASKPITMTEAVWVNVMMVPSAAAWCIVPRLPSR